MLEALLMWNSGGNMRPSINSVVQWKGPAKSSGAHNIP